MKKCSKCGVVKPMEDFHKKSWASDGRMSACKECECAQKRQRYRADPEKFKRRVRRYYRDNREAQQEAERSRYRRNREDYLRRDREYAERHPERIAAKNKVNTEIRAGRLSRQPCEECGAENAEAHHDDYSKPLDVRWLCPTHHRRHHNEISDMP